MESHSDNSTGAKTVAVVDIGSNSVRMVVAQVAADGQTDVLERLQRAVGLGQDTFVDGRLSQRTMNAAVGILRNYRRVLDHYEVKHVRAVATSAVREAGNADAFTNRILMATGLDAEIIEPSEESRLTVGAVRRAMGKAACMRRGETLIVDVGGGSALLTLLHRGELASSGSYRLGSIRMQEVLATSRERPERAADLLHHQIAGVISGIKQFLKLKKVKAFIAIGGDARFAAEQIGELLRGQPLHRVGRAEFTDFAGRCAKHSADELARKYAIPFANAETLVPALLAYQHLLAETNAAEVIVSDISMRDGLLYDVARSATGEEDAGLADAIVQSAKSLGEKFGYDSDHANHVAELAGWLFDSLQAEHGMAGRHRMLLRLAAILHEVGGYVSSRAHHKHSYYILANSEIFGLRRDELEIVAHVARYHRRSEPKPSHLTYMSLPRETRIAVSKLAAVLRVADALDHGHAQQIRGIELEQHGDELVIYVPNVTDLSLERKNLASKAGLFEDIFGMTVRLESAAT